MSPNPAHVALAALQAHLGDDFFLCTQNVDGLHEGAGSRRPDNTEAFDEVRLGKAGEVLPGLFAVV